MPTKIRFATVQDAAQIAAIYAPFCTDSAVSFEITAPTAEEMAQRIANTMLTYPWLVCEAEGEVLGYVYASKHRERAAYRWSVDVAVYIHPAHRGQRIGKALYTQLFDLLRRQRFYSAYAGIALPNPGSIGLHQAMGFKSVGIYQNVGFKAGAWRDVAWLGLELQPPAVSPAEPRALADLLRTAEFSDAMFPSV